MLQKYWSFPWSFKYFYLLILCRSIDDIFICLLGIINLNILNVTSGSNIIFLFCTNICNSVVWVYWALALCLGFCYCPIYGLGQHRNQKKIQWTNHNVRSVCNMFSSTIICWVLTVWVMNSRVCIDQADKFVQQDRCMENQLPEM